MRLDEFLDSELLIAELSASTKKEVLAELISMVSTHHTIVSPEQLLHVLHERESLGSTGIGEGIAIPHGKIVGLEKIMLVVARSTQGVDFEALDGHPVHYVFMVLAPDNAGGIHLRLLAHISRLLKYMDFRSAFMEAPDKEALFQLLASS